MADLNRRKRRLSDRLTLAADALVLTVVAGAAYILIKDFLAIPAAWIDPVDAFLITMALSSATGATASWLIHHRPSKGRGLSLLFTGLLAAVGGVYVGERLILQPVASSLVPAPMLFTTIQIVGLLTMLALFAAGAVDLLGHERRRLNAVGIARLAALAALASLVAFAFIPEARTNPAAAQVDAFLGLATIAGALGVTIGDFLLQTVGRRAGQRESDSTVPPGDVA